MSRDFRFEYEVGAETIWDQMPNRYILEGAKWALADMLAEEWITDETARHCCELIDKVLHEYYQEGANVSGHTVAGVEPEERRE